MKTYAQFNEDLEQRRKELRQRQLDQMATHKKRIELGQAAQRERSEYQKEREGLKREIKKELQIEQTPSMQPNEYNKQVARRQATQKSAQIRHVHQEIGAEARQQQNQKRLELKAIMSR